MRQNEAVIRVDRVGFSYPVRSGLLKWSRYWPLLDISFEVFRGETLGLIGKNGVGKSSLLRMIAGIVEPDLGQIINRGVSVSLQALGVGFLPHLSGRENAILNGMLMGLSKKEIESRMELIISFSGLRDFIDRPLRTYSSGMKSRLGFAAAIQADPDVLLIDEVLGVGDDEFRVKSLAEMKKIIRSNKTVVLVSHQENIIKELCDRVIWIEDGSIQFIGSTQEALAQYSSSTKNK